MGPRETRAGEAAGLPVCRGAVGLEARALRCQSCDMDCNLPGSSVHEFFKARVLEWVVISSPALQAYYSITYGLLLNHKI